MTTGPGSPLSDAEATVAAQVEAGEHERRLAFGSIAQQLSMVASVVTMLFVVTALGRTLTLAEFGTYGLLVSLSGYLLVAQGSVEGSAIKAIAEARTDEERATAFSTAMALYTLFGLAAAVLIVGGGIALLGVFDIPSSLHHQAVEGLVALAVVTAFGWPLKTFQDLLRGNQLFGSAAASEVCAYVAVALGMAVLLEVNAPLWSLVALGGALPLLVGAAAVFIAAWRKVRVHWQRSAVTRESIRDFFGLSAYLLLMGLADLVIYSLDRAVLAAFRSAAAVGLYEAPIRAHNLVRQLHGGLVVPVLPAAARYVAEGDAPRQRDLLVRGTRYILAVVVPLSVALMTLGAPLLEAWLGSKFRVAAPALAIIVGYWLVAANTGVAGTMLVAAGRARALTKYTWSVAILSLALSLALTPHFGLNGVVAGTTIAYTLLVPYLIRMAMEQFDVTATRFVRDAWVPAYATGALLAVVMVALRLTVGIEGAAAVLGAGAGGVVGYWAVYYFAWLKPSERLLVRDLLRRTIGFASAALRRSPLRGSSG